jgi:hypothetical protein
MTSNRRLLYWYRKYNALYHGGKLNNDPNIYYDNIDGACDKMGDMWVYPDGKVLIRISVQHHDFNCVKISIHHEMTHVKIWPDKRHSKAFYKEQDRLIKLGAYKGLL